MVTFTGELTTAVSWFSTTASTVSTDATTASNAASATAADVVAASGFADSASDFADNAASAAGATVWVSAAAYTAGDGVSSPVDFQTYRAKLTHSGVATDPSADATNWQRISTSGVYDDLTGLPTLGTAAATDATDYATAAQGATADTAYQSSDLASQVQAEAGTDNTTLMTPLRTAEAIAALVSSDSVAALTPAATVNVDLSTATIFTLTPNANTTFTLSNTTAVDSFTLTLTGFDITTGYQLASAAYDTVSFSVNSQDAVPLDITFSTDGTKMYMVGNTTDSVYQYTLSTGFDLSTASYDTVSFSVNSQDTSPYGIAFSTDGTKMYVLGNTNKTVYQYTLSTGFDLSTASYDTVSFSVNSQDTSPTDYAFSTDGTKMYVLGNTNKTVYQYTLSTGFDLSTASYDTVSFSVNSQDANPYGIAFSTDGTKMYMVGNTTDSAYQYTLSTGFDLSTASYDTVSFSVNSQDASPFGLAFSTDGTKMYMVGNTTDSVYQYSTSVTALATFTYPAAFKWAGGTAPDAPANGEVDVLTFFTTDTGTTWYGFQDGDAMA